jgi:uncharacterized YigZ family protein
VISFRFLNRLFKTILLSDYYFTIEKNAVAEFKDRGSRFIGYSFPIASINDFKERLAEIKKEHPKATHHCFAYRLGLDGNTFRASDDGEPSGSAGKPILGQIDSKELSNVLVIVVRYYGGTLLGVPGLINAYKTAAALCLQTIPIVQKPVLVKYKLQFDYTQLNNVMRILKQADCQIYQQEVQLFCVLSAGIPKTRLEEVLYRFKDLHGLEVVKE